MKQTMIKMAAAAVLLVSTGSASEVLAQAPAPTPGASAPVQSGTANGVIMLTMPPAATAPQGTPPTTSLVWLYDTNLKEIILCSSRADTSFICTTSYKPSW